MKKILTAVALSLTALHAPACGPYFDYTYIVAASPRRAFQLPELSLVHELGKIPLESPSTNARSVLPEGVALRDLCNIGPLPEQIKQWHDSRVDPATAADLTDLFVALTETGVDEATAIDICRDYFSVRAGFDKRLTTPALRPLPLRLHESLLALAQLPREFFLYLDGARAFHQEKYGEAAAAFEAVLALPPEERRYRTTWALYMLGRMAAMAQQYPELAALHPEIVTDPLPLFEMVRQSTAEGFVNSDDMAAGTYYQEALLAAEACDPVKELHALARYSLAGNQHTTWSLKQASLKLANMETIPSDVLADRLSRSALVAFAASHVDARPKQAERILTDLNTSGLELTTYESGRLAWIAYALGRIDEAKALVRLAPEDPYAIWTESRLKLRSGDLEGAVALLEKAVPLFERNEAWEHFEDRRSGNGYKPFDALQNEQGILSLARDRYVDSLDLFLLGRSWVDAAYVAEHVLTLDELLLFYRKCEKEKRYTEPHAGHLYGTVYSRPPSWAWARDASMDKPPLPSQLDRLRVLVGRRMLREKRYTGAVELFPVTWRHLAVAYVHHRRAILTAQDNKSRAFHQVQSAHLLRHWGMELTGYEADPDFTYVEGQYFYQRTSALRSEPESWHRFAARAVAQNDFVSLFGEWEPEAFDEQWMNDLPDFIPLIQPTREERRRLDLNSFKPYHRWHYRFIAAGIFERAAGLLPDQTEEKAQALFYGGQVLKKVARYEDAATQMRSLHRSLVNKCDTLEIGKSAKSKGWFPDEPEAWEKAFGMKGLNEAALALASDKKASRE